jgi:acyl-CoA dehydrogenase
MPISFEPTEDQALMQQAVASFAAGLRTKIREHEKARGLPVEVRKAAHEMGLGHVGLPEEVGGAGLGLTTAVLLEEEIAFGDPSAAFAFGGGGTFARAVLELGTPEQAKALLAPLVGEKGFDTFGAVAWSERRANPERPGLSTRATRLPSGGWRIDGEKAFVLDADRAHSFVVFAQVEDDKGWDGLGAFVVTRATKGLGVGARTTTLGLDLASVGSIRLEGVEVADADRLAGNGDFGAALLRFFMKSALVIAARCVGLSRAAFEVTLEYCQGRKAFGKPVGHFQSIAFTLADRAMDVDASRALVWRAAAAWDAGAGSKEDALLHSAYAVSYALEAAMRCGDDAVQLHGGAGFMRDYAVEKFMRDAKQLQVCVMTSEQADQLAATIELGRPIDLAMVLPTAESQSTLV